MRAESLDQLTKAELLKNETSRELREKLGNSSQTLEGLDKKNGDIEQKYLEVVFNINHLRKSMWCLGLFLFAY